MTTRRTYDGVYEFEIRPNTHGVWIRYIKENRELYLFPDDVAELVRFVMEVRLKGNNEQP